MHYDPFRPSVNGTVSITAGTTSQRIALAGKTSTEHQCLVTLRTTGADIPHVFVAFGSSTVTASSTGLGFPMLANTSRVVSLRDDWAYVAAISTAAGPVVWASMGEGQN